jgi:hypothetical protein
MRGNGLAKSVALLGRKIGSGASGGIKRSLRAGTHLIARATGGESQGKVNRAVRGSAALIAENTSGGSKGGVRRAVRGLAHLIAGNTGWGSHGGLHRRAGRAVSKIVDHLIPGNGFHLRRMAPVVLFAAALAESAHAPLLKGAKAMNQNAPGAPRVQSAAGAAGQKDKGKSDADAPVKPADDKPKLRIIEPYPDLTPFDPSPELEPIDPTQPISLIHGSGGETINFGPGGGGDGGGGGSTVPDGPHGEIVHGDQGGGGGGGGDGAGGAGGGSDTPIVFGPSVVVTVPEPTALIWTAIGGTLMLRRRRTSSPRIHIRD